MNRSNPTSAGTNAEGTDHRRPSQRWFRLPVVILIATVLVSLSAVSALATSSPISGWEQSDGTIPGGTIPCGTVPGGTVPGGTIPGGTIPCGTVPPPVTIYLGFKNSDEIEFDDDDDEREDFVYKNEDIIAYDVATGEFSIFFDGSECGLEDANLDDFELWGSGMIFTLRSDFKIPGLGKVDDSDVISYTPSTDPNASCGTFGFYVRGKDVGLTKGDEDIDALGFAEDGSLLVSTIGTAKVPTLPSARTRGDDDDDDDDNKLKVKDRSLIKLDQATGTWSLYFEGDDVKLKRSSEDVRSVSVGGTTGNIIYLTISGDFEVESFNEDEGDKNDIEACVPISLGENTECFFFKLLDGESIGAENQLDGLALEFAPARAAITAVGGTSASSAREADVEAAADVADYVEATASEDSEVSLDDFFDIVSRIYLSFVGK
jgi:hypothetical protein